MAHRNRWFTWVYLLKMVIFHGELLNNQRVNQIINCWVNIIHSNPPRNGTKYKHVSRKGSSTMFCPWFPNIIKIPVVIFPRGAMYYPRNTIGHLFCTTPLRFHGCPRSFPQWWKFWCVSAMFQLHQRLNIIPKIAWCFVNPCTKYHKIIEQFWVYEYNMIQSMNHGSPSNEIHEAHDCFLIVVVSDMQHASGCQVKDSSSQLLWRKQKTQWSSRYTFHLNMTFTATQQLWTQTNNTADDLEIIEHSIICQCN